MNTATATQSLTTQSLATQSLIVQPLARQLLTRPALRRIAGSAPLVVALLLWAGMADAGPGKKHRAYGPADSSYSVEARVLDVEPLLRVVQVTVPQEVCWDEPVRHTTDAYESRTPTVLGGILGGVVGNQFGGGSGRKLMTAAGVLLGASMGRDAGYRNRQPRSSYVTYEEVCEVEQVTHEEERSDGYRVTYEYGGREFVTHTAVPPGRTLRVRVQVEPLPYN